MRFLLSSLLLVMCFSCASYPKKNKFKPTLNTSISILNTYFSDASKDYIYKANINAFDKKLGGIFIVKKLGQEHHRIVFTTELGNKIFDFTFNGNDFKVNQILKELDKKLLINILRNDLKVLITESPTILKTFSLQEDAVFQTNINGKNHFHYFRQKELYKITRVKSGKGKVEFLFSGINDELANQIEINHKNINLTIVLKSI